MAAQEVAAGASGPWFAPDDPTLPAPWKAALIDGATLYYWNPETNYEKPGAAAAAPPCQWVLRQRPLCRFQNPHQGLFHSLACSLAKLVRRRTRSGQAWAAAAAADSTAGAATTFSARASTATFFSASYQQQQPHMPNQPPQYPNPHPQHMPYQQGPYNMQPQQQQQGPPYPYQADKQPQMPQPAYHQTQQPPMPQAAYNQGQQPPMPQSSYSQGQQPAIPQSAYNQAQPPQMPHAAYVLGV
uniref:WW domain-containing protein n=1 Tax=Setaria viridis TaxID=4556 RepID=A0A4U6U9R7_SETVI|nr:LOW QUALITY PROTEIN: hypothetical protein SEVIR_5G045400v2 [Setaria viridis]